MAHWKRRPPSEGITSRSNGSLGAIHDSIVSVTNEDAAMIAEAP
jgi:hypothetical protein